MSPTPLSELGEFGLIQRIKSNAPPYLVDTLIGIGDDAAVLNLGNKDLILTTDMLIEGVHFDIRYAPLHTVGYKAVSVNVSDCCAMNVFPSHILVSMAVSSKYSLEAIDAIYDGIFKGCKRYKIDLIGGDTNTAIKGLTLSITCLGYANKGQVVLRSGAQVNDIICVSGNLGAAYAGLLLLEREKKIFLENSNIQPDLSTYPYIIERQLKPEARVDLIQFFNEKNIMPTAMMDISDGLANALIELCSASDKGCMLFEDHLPIHAETKQFLEEVYIAPFIAALNGGEDYELLFTLNPSDFDKVKTDNRITPIGYITPSNQNKKIRLSNSKEVDLEMKGYNAFGK